MPEIRVEGLICYEPPAQTPLFTALRHYRHS